MIGNVGKSKELFILFSMGCIAAIFFFVFLPLPAMGEEEENEGDESLKDLLGKEPDELQDIVVYVTTASRRPEKLWETAAAAYVLSTTDIQRSAATNVADLLRMVPGLFVGNLNSNFTVYGARGFAYEFCVDFLVLIDGRQLNYMHWGGLFWDVQDYPLEDIERIEVILGPGGTLWGTNSGNGVINIITKHTRDTQGGLMSGITGTDLYKGVVRYGGKLGEDAFYRVYGLFKDVDDFNDSQGRESVDDWALQKGGFRIDWQPTDQDELTFQGDAYQSDAWSYRYLYYIPDEFYTPGQTRYLREKDGLDLLVEWEHRFDDESEMKWQTYYDYFEINQPTFTYFNYDTLKTDFQYRFSPFSNHDLIVGSGYRLISDDTEKGIFVYDPLSANDQTFTAFVQDTITLIEDELKLSLGTQIQWSDYSGFDYQPSARLVYTPYDNYTVWASITRAAQHFYRGHNELNMPVKSFPFTSDPLLPAVVYLDPMGHTDSHIIDSFEIGHRLQATRNLSIELSLFYNNMDDMISAEVDSKHIFLMKDPFPHYRLNMLHGNKGYGESYGAELALNAQVTDFWKLSASYAISDVQLHRRPDSIDQTYTTHENLAPHHQVKVHSYFNITQDIQFDLAYYYIAEMNNKATSLIAAPHSRLDVRLNWQSTEQLDVSIVGTNLLDDQTREALGMFSIPTEVERGVYAKLTYRF